MRTTPLSFSFCLLFCFGFLGGCSRDSYDAQAERLSKLVRNGPIGSTDQWLEKYSDMTSDWQRTALIFGYGDDYEACLDIVKGLTEQYPANQYRCTPAH